MAKSRFSQERILQDAGILLDNLVNQPVISEKMNLYGYGTEKVAEGKKIWDTAKQNYDLTKRESAESSQAYADYTQGLNTLKEGYSLDRKKVKTLFKGKAEVLKTLSVDKVESRSYSIWIAEVERFYNALEAETELLQQLQPMQMNLDGVKAQQKKVREVIAAYSVYIREKGESQDATKKKEEAFKHLSEWIRTCYAVAKIALREEKQLLESLAKLVKG